MSIAKSQIIKEAVQYYKDMKVIKILAFRECCNDDSDDKSIAYQSAVNGVRYAEHELAILLEKIVDSANE